MTNPTMSAEERAANVARAIAMGMLKPDDFPSVFAVQLRQAEQAARLDERENEDRYQIIKERNEAHAEVAQQHHVLDECRRLLRGIDDDGRGYRKQMFKILDEALKAKA